MTKATASSNKKPFNKIQVNIEINSQIFEFAHEVNFSSKGKKNELYHLFSSSSQMKNNSSELLFFFCQSKKKKLVFV